MAAEFADALDRGHLRSRRGIRLQELLRLHLQLLHELVGDVCFLRMTFSREHVAGLSRFAVITATRREISREGKSSARAQKRRKEKFQFDRTVSTKLRRGKSKRNISTNARG